MLRAIVVLALSVASALTLAGAGENPTSPINKTTNATDWKMLGHQLSADIDALYYGRTPHKEAHYNDPNGLDISDTVIKYCPIGITFDNAESILLSAGFAVSKRTAVEEGNTKAPARMEGYIEPYQHFLIFLSYHSSVKVTLLPKEAGDFREVGAVSGRIFWPAL
jgi:hypothetical protein